MFVRGLIAVGMSLALLAGSAAGQEVTLEEILEKVRSDPHRLSPENQERLRKFLEEHEMALALYPGNVWAKGVAPLETEVELEALVDDAMSREVADVMGESRQIVVIHKLSLIHISEPTRPY